MTTLWSTDPQYNFGFVVPILAALMAWRRWGTRPEPEGHSPGFLRALGGCVALFPPLWFLLQPSPDWRLLNWISSLVATMALVFACGALGGRAWARHFFFPAAFLLTAVPWPAGLEQSVTQSLMGGVAGTASEILSLIGIPALAEGNLVQIGNGTLNVDLACSGIRSLQPSLMMGLAMGEIFRLPVLRRSSLFVGAALIAFLTNTGRVVTLGVLAHRKGMPAIDSWHDPAGTLLVTICFLLVWLLSVVLSRKCTPPETPLIEGRANHVSRFFIGATLLWIAGGVVAAEVWFRNDTVSPGKVWKLSPPPNARPIKIDPNARAMLRYDDAVAWGWMDAQGRTWEGFQLQWMPGPAHSRLLLNMHRPDVCLPATGLRLIEDRGSVLIQTRGGSESFHAYVFESPRGNLHVYYSLTRNGEPLMETGESVRTACLRAVAERRRTVSQELIQFAIRGSKTTEETDEALGQALGELLTK